MNSKRHALSLAAVLAAAVLTGGAAIAGVLHSPRQQPSQPAVVQQVQASPAAAQDWEGGD